LSVSPVLNDEEISAKLKELSVLKLGLDKSTEKLVGKLLMDEKDEEVNADSETFSKLYAMMGGSVVVIAFVMQNLFFRTMSVY